MDVSLESFAQTHSSFPSLQSVPMADIMPTPTTESLPTSLSEPASQPSDTHETPLLATPAISTADPDEVDEPPTKKAKIVSNDKSRLLEDRIVSILSCCICLDLSTLPMFQVIPIRRRQAKRTLSHLQCVNGHLMCASCFNHLLADCKLKDEQTTW